MMLDFLKDFFSFLPELFIMAHTCGFEMIGEFSYILQIDGLGLAILWLFLGVSLIVCVLCLDAFMILGIFVLINNIKIMILTKSVNRQPVIGTVKSKKYKEEYTTYEYNVALKIPMTKFHPEEYNVKVEYNGVTETFDSKKLFKKYKKGDSIPLIFVQNLDKNDIPLKERLELPD